MQCPKSDRTFDYTLGSDAEKRAKFIVFPVEGAMTSAYWRFNYKWVTSISSSSEYLNLGVQAYLIHLNIFQVTKHHVFLIIGDIEQKLLTEICEKCCRMFRVTRFSVVFLSRFVNENEWQWRSWIWPSALFMYCMFWHGTRGLRQNNKRII